MMQPAKKVEIQNFPATASDVDIVQLQVSNAIGQFKQLVSETDQQAIKNDNVIPQHMAGEIRDRFHDITVRINDLIGDRSALESKTKAEIGAYIQCELLPYMLLTTTGERFYSKPRGYAGDFLTIEWIYRNRPSGFGRLGTLLDGCFLDLRAAKAVRHRRRILVKEISDVVTGKQNYGRARVTSLACGPAAEVFDVLDQLEGLEKPLCTLVDLDYQALAYVSDESTRRKQHANIRLENRNILRLVTGRQKLDLPPQDLVYSIGLIDYFNDQFVLRLIDYIYELLAPGGKVVLGNFHPKNPDKVLMDHILDWKLTHRTEDQMNRLFSKSRFAGPCTEIEFEQEGINLFAKCIRRTP